MSEGTRSEKPGGESSEQSDAELSVETRGILVKFKGGSLSEEQAGQLIMETINKVVESKLRSIPFEDTHRTPNPDRSQE